MLGGEEGAVRIWVAWEGGRMEISRGVDGGEGGWRRVVRWL